MLEQQATSRSSRPAEEKNDMITLTPSVVLNNHDGFFDPSVFDQSFFNPNHKSAAGSSSTVNSAAAKISPSLKAKSRAERHAKEAYLKTIDERVSCSDDMSSSQQSVGLGLSEYLSQGSNNNRQHQKLNSMDDDNSSCCSVSTTETSYTNASNYSSYSRSSIYSCNSHSSKFGRISASASGGFRRYASLFTSVDQDEEGCCFCPCFTTMDDHDENEQQQSPLQRQQLKNNLLQRLICNPLLQCFQSIRANTHLQAGQSILYQNPIFYRLSLQMQQRFPRSRRRASDPIIERPVISATRLFFLRIHYKSLMMGMILALIIVKFNSGGTVGVLLNNKDSFYVAVVPVDEYSSGGNGYRGSPPGWNNGDRQQQNQQLLESLGYHNDIQRGGSVGRHWVDLRGPPPPREGADPADQALDSSSMIDEAVVTELEQIIIQQQWQKQDEATRVEQERIESEEGARQQQLNAELARQQERLKSPEQEQLQQHPPQQQTTTVDANLAELNNLKNTWEPHEPNDIAILWHVRESGGSVIRHAIGGCHRLVQASGFGIRDGHAGDDQVGVIYPSEGSPFVNIDSTTIAGIKRAASMRFADAQVADVVVSPLIYESNELFTHSSKGRFFAIFRHPIDRAVRLFYSLKEVEPGLREWTLERYSKSTYVENNLMTRQLSNKLEGPLDESHYRKAMEIVRQKFLVGLATQIDQSLDRYEKYFRWTFRVHPESQEACRKRVLSEASSVDKKIKKLMPKEGDATWAWLLHHNAFDLRLYAYIEKLFEEQAVFVKGVMKNFRNYDTTCCRCEPATFPNFNLDGDDDDEIPSDDNMKNDGGEGVTQKSTFEGGIRLLRRLPPALISALFVPCTVDDFWLADRESADSVRGV
jgi:hypothetical protein